MKKFLVLLLSILLLAGIASAEEKDNDILGKPFPDFTATDTEGNTFTLSEVLKDHEAVLINFWATWCGPCRNEFPHLNEAFEKYRDRVAFIALSKEKKDTVEKIAEYRKANGLAFPMGRDEDLTLFKYLGGENSVPKTVVVDRFGNAAFLHNGVFTAADQVGRVLDTFLGDGYKETAVLDGIPQDTATRSYPVAAERAIYPDSGNCRKLILHMTTNPEPFTAYIVPDDSVRLRIEFTAEDPASSMIYADLYQGKPVNVLSLLDPERGVFVYEQEMYDASDEDRYVDICLYDDSDEEDPKMITVYLFRNEEDIGKMAEKMKADDAGELTWEYAEAEKTENAPQAYIVHVVDQDGKPVPEVSVNFCTDEACTPKESDENGLITFDGKPYKYHVQIIDVPEGYSCDESFEMYTTPVYSEWTLRIRKD